MRTVEGLVCLVDWKTKTKVLIQETEICLLANQNLATTWTRVVLYLEARVAPSILSHVTLQQLRDDGGARERHYGVLVRVGPLQQLPQNIRLLPVAAAVAVADQRAVSVLVDAVRLVHTVEQGLPGAGE